MLLVLKIFSQIISVVLAGLVSLLDYKFKDGRTKNFKRIRISLLFVSIAFLITSVTITILDDFSNTQKEIELKAQLEKVQEQNDGLQKGIAVLSDKSSDLLKEQRDSFVTLLDDQRKLSESQRESGLNTERNIKNSTELLNLGIEKNLLKQETLISQQRYTLSNLTGGNGYCYLHIVDPEKIPATLYIKSEGEFPLYDIFFSIVEQRILDENPAKGLMSRVFRSYILKPKIRIGDFGVNETKYIKFIKLPVSNDIRIVVTFSARNGLFYEQLRLKKVDGKWRSAMRVKKVNFIDENEGDSSNSIILRQYIDSDFPIDNADKIW